MRKINNLIKMLVLCGGLFFASCETTELDLTQNPNALSPVDADPDFYMNSIQLSYAYLIESFGNTAGAVTRIDYMSGRDYANAYQPGSFNSRWSSAYQTIMQDIREMNVIADEPTTALDVTVQKEIILLLKELQKENKMSILLISHDLSLVSEIADDVIILFKGQIVEKGNTTDIFHSPQHDYTKGLINSKPNLNQRLKKLPTVEDFIKNRIFTDVYSKKEREAYHSKIYGLKPLLEIVDVKKYFNTSDGFIKKPLIKAVDKVSFKLYEGETLGLVGESGCGKTTLGRSIMQLEKVTSGKIFYKGKDIAHLSKTALQNLRKEIQIIFQDPFSSLNPRISIGNAILEPMNVHGVLSNHKERKIYVIELLKKVGLEEDHFNKYPHEFSGGQRQRIGIARAIALKPKIIICDESVSALDVSVQAQVLNLLNELKSTFNFSYIFISHDLSVVKYMSDQLVVMNKGKIEEIGDADTIYKTPKSEYTRNLIDAIPKGI